MQGLSNFNISRSDWWIVLTARSNVLIEGTEARTDAVVATLCERLQTPLRNWTGRPPDVHDGTLVVRAVDTLDTDGQRALLDYLTLSNGSGTVQVVSTSAEPLFPRIERGLFLEELYYRLNTVRLDLEEER